MYQFEDKRIDVTIKWEKPISIEQLKALTNNDCEQTYFYKIVGRHGDQYKLFYIGKSVRQYFTKRIFQRDHLNKRADFQVDYKKHKIMFSLGNVIEKSHLKDETDDIGNIERLLIYSHTNPSFKYMKNKQCKLNHNVIKNYRINNKGWRKDNMYQIVAYGLFVNG
jgi:hypothetical protein